MADGFIILDKDTGLFSRTAGGRVARMFGMKKFGHIGTLDPMATGVLPIAIGAATKMIPFIEDMHHPKEYLFGVQFGFETDTLDITGRETARNNVIPATDDILRTLPNFIGEISQVPPLYSAVHVGGARAYELARRGADVQMPARNVTVYELELIGWDGNRAEFRMRCSAGTYVRSIARDIAAACHTIATVDMIRRTQTNGFSIKNAVKLDFLENLFNNGADIGQYLMPTDYGLGDIPVCDLNDKDAALYANGGFIKTAQRDGLYRVYCGKKLVGIGRVLGGTLRPKRTI